MRDTKDRDHYWRCCAPADPRTPSSRSAALRRRGVFHCRHKMRDLTGLLPLIIVVAASSLASSEPVDDAARRCPACRVGVMVRLELLSPQAGVDSS